MTMLSEASQVDLARTWESRRRWARHSSRVIKVRIAIIFMTSTLAALLKVGGGRAGMIEALASLAFIIWAFVQLLRAKDRADPFSQPFPPGPMPEAAALKLRHIVEPLARKMSVDLACLELLLARRQLDANPFVWHKGERDVLVIPLGFLKLLNEKPRLAEAILAHELAHIAQGDSRLWHTATAYLRLLRRYLIPFQVILLIPTVLAGALLYTNAGASYEQELMYLQMTGPINEPFARQMAELSADSDRTEALRIIISHVGSVLLALVFARTIEKKRRESEELADLGTMAFSDGLALKEALLSLSVNPSSPEAGFHPTLSERIAKLNSALGIEEPPPVPLVSTNRSPVVDFSCLLKEELLHELQAALVQMPRSPVAAWRLVWAIGQARALAPMEPLVAVPLQRAQELLVGHKHEILPLLQGWLRVEPLLAELGTALATEDPDETQNNLMALEDVLVVAEVLGLQEHVALILTEVARLAAQLPPSMDGFDALAHQRIGTSQGAARALWRTLLAEASQSAPSCVPEALQL